MKNILFSAAIVSVVFLAVSCKKVSVNNVEKIYAEQQKTTTQQKSNLAPQNNCPEGSVVIRVSSETLTGAIDMNWNNPYSTFKAINITIYRIETGGNQVFLMHHMLGVPGSGTMVADLLPLPANTIGFSYTIDCYKFDEVKGSPCSTFTGYKYL